MKTSLKVLSDEANYDPSPKKAKNVREAINLIKSGKCVSNISDFNDNKVVMLLAVIRDGNNLEFASERLKKDREVVKAAVSNYGLALKYADQTLKKDYEIATLAIVNDGVAIKYVDESIIDEIMVENAIQFSGGKSILWYLGTKFRSNAKIAMLAIESNLDEVNNIDESLYSNIGFINQLHSYLKHLYNRAGNNTIIKNRIKEIMIKLPLDDGTYDSDIHSVLCLTNPVNSAVII